MDGVRVMMGMKNELKFKVKSGWGASDEVLGEIRDDFWRRSLGVRSVGKCLRRGCERPLGQ